MGLKGLLVKVKRVNGELLNRKHHVVSAYKNSSCIIYGGVGATFALHFLVFSPNEGLTTLYKQPHAFGPKRRSGHAGVYTTLHACVLPSISVSGTCSAVQGLLIFGGWGGRDQGPLYNDFWFLDSATFTWHMPVFKGDVPCTVNLGVLEQWTDDSLILYRGGDGIHHNSDLWVLNTRNGVWRKICRQVSLSGTTTEAWPPERTGVCGCVLPGPALLLGGGWNASGILDDWWLYKDERWVMLTVSDLVGCRTGAKLKYLPRMKCVFLIGGKTPNDAECAPLLIADVEKILEDNKTTGKATPAGNAATTAGNAAATTGTGNAATRTDPTRTDQRLGGTHLDFVKVTCLEGSFNGIVGHDVCLVDNKVLVVGGVDTVHKEPIGGCSIISIDATTGFTRSPDRDFIFTRPMGCFDTLGCIQFAIDESLADVEFECGGPDSVILPAHMVILAGKSEYFCSSFQALKIATAKAATAIQRAGVARTAALRSAPDRRTVGELSTNSLATMVAAHTNSLVAGSESSYLPTPHLERPRRPRLQASHFATPVCFEVFLTLFYSYHLPTCLLVANSKANWSQEFPETDRQSMAVLVWFAMTHNYNNVLNGKPNVPLPFATKVVHDTISCLLVLAQLADEYLFDKLSAHLEVYLACLANEKTALDRLYQASTNFTMDKLKAYLEDVYQKKPTLMTTTPQPKYLPPPPTTSDHLPPGYGFRSTYTTECPDSPGTGISPGYSPAALPPLRERNYGSGRDMGRRPPPPVAHMTTQTDSRRLREILFKHR